MPLLEFLDRLGSDYHVEIRGAVKLWVERRPPFGDRDGFVLIINGSPNKAQIQIYIWLSMTGLEIN